MLLIAVSVALLVAPCVSQNGAQLSEFGLSLSAECRRDENNSKHSLVKKTFLDRFNHLRQKIANGEDVENLINTGPKLMYGTRYSCPLQDIASKLLENGKTQHPTYLVFNYTSTKSGPFKAQVNDAIKKLKTNAPDTLLSPYVPFLGCALEEIQLRTRLLCIFYKEPSVPSVQPRAPCTEDSDCPLYEGRSTCSQSLCWAPTGYEVVQ